MKRIVKFGFWNIEGLSLNNDSKLENQEFINTVKQHDIFALAETHIGEEDMISVEGYNCVKLCRAKNVKINRYFGGIAVLYKKELKNGLSFLEHRNNDYIWLKLSKEFFNFDEDLYMCVAYIPPENSNYYKVRGQDTFSYIENDILRYSCLGKIALLGDFNARTSTESDFIDGDSDIDTNDNEYHVDKAILLRNSQDNILCQRGKKVIDLCLSAQLRIVNGRVIGDSLGQYTCHKYCGSSVIDYLITSEENLQRILYFKVTEFKGQMSDHCCLSWALKCNISNYNNMSKTVYSSMPDSFK